MYYLLGDFPSISLKQAKLFLDAAKSSILQNEQQYLEMKKPKGKQLFLYYCSEDKDDSYKADGYRFRANRQNKNSDTGVICKYFCINLPHTDSNVKVASVSNLFKRLVFHLIDDNLKSGTPVLVHYTGNEKVASDFPHGNSTKEKPFLPTTKAALRKIDQNCKLYPSVQKTYMALVDHESKLFSIQIC